MIELHLECNEQEQDCILLRLRATNCGEERLLLPQPDITGVIFIDSNTNKQAEWYTSFLQSSRWAGITLAPAEHRDIDFRVRPCGVQRPKEESATVGDAFRWCVELRSASYSVYYFFSVDRDYFDGDSHWGFPQLQREAANQSAIPWLGTAQSNVLTIKGD